MNIQKLIEKFDSRIYKITTPLVRARDHAMDTLIELDDTADKIYEERVCVISVLEKLNVIRLCDDEVEFLDVVAGNTYDTETEKFIDSLVDRMFSFDLKCLIIDLELETLEYAIDNVDEFVESIEEIIYMDEV